MLIEGAPDSADAKLVLLIVDAIRPINHSNGDTYGE